MRKHLRVVAAIVAAVMLLTGCATNAGNGGNTNNPGNSNGSASNGNLTIADNAVDFAANMKLGWNLGNTLDANGGQKNSLTSETSWGQPLTTKEMIEFVKASGFTTIRIPVSWANHTDEEFNIDAEWMARVKEIVDWSLDAGLYVILNSHHDNDVYYPTAENSDRAVKYLATIWTQIAEEFKDYDERLVFQAMNEPRLAGTPIEWWFQQNDAKGIAAIKQINVLNQIFVTTIRDNKSECNQKRYLMVGSYAASPDFALNSAFVVPDDPSNRLMISIHAYTPYDFAMNANGYKNWDGTHVGDLGFIQRLNNTFVQKGYGVVIDEFGATNKGNDADRIAWAKDYTGKAANFGISCVLWDNGGTNIGEENFGMIDRRNLKIFFPDLLDAYLSSYK